MTHFQNLGLSGILAIASILPATHSMNAQQLTDAQAQALLQTLVSQNQGASLTAAQNQMLMQYILSKQSSSSGKDALSTAQSQVQMQMMLQQLTSGAQRLPGVAATSLLSQSSGGPGTAVTAPATLGDKKPGVVRIGIVMPKSQLGQGPTAGEPLRGMLLQYLLGPTVEVTAIAALLPEQIEAEAKSKQCDYLVYSSLSQKKAGGFGLLKNAGSMANMIPMVGMMNGMSGVVAAATAATAASQAATLSNAVKAKSDVTLDYYVTGAGNATPVLTNSLKARANTDGEDVISPLVAQEAAAIMTQVSKKN